MKIAYDIKLMRPGCALLQAAMGGDQRVCYSFPTDSWLLVPTPDLKLYEIDKQQLAMLVLKTQTNVSTSYEV